MPWSRALLEASPVPLIVFGLEGNLLSANQQAASLCGCASVEELIAQRKTAANLFANDAFLSTPWPPLLEISLALSQERRLHLEIRSSLLKDPQGDPLAMLSVLRDTTEQHAAEESLRKSEEKYRLLFQNSALAVGVRSTDGHYLEFNDAYQRMLGYTEQELKSLTTFDLTHPADVELSRQYLSAVASGKVPLQRYEKRYLHKNGSVVWGDVCIQPLRNREGNITAIIGTVVDITERRRTESQRAELEEQLRQAQKMETIGRLAGGVAHDFNNLLTAILGNLSLALLETQPSDPLHPLLTEISHAADSAASLTRQLLTFSRKQVIDPRVLNLNDLIANLHKMLGRLMGEDIDLKLRLAPELRPVLVDPTQIEQVLVNLCVNARDAMPNGGTLILGTANALVEENLGPPSGPVPPGKYVRLSISDSGVGMPPEVLDHLFEPFFTTKEPGKGTGLGLAMVYGAVQQHDGHVVVRTEVGLGTTVALYFPQVLECQETQPTPTQSQIPGGNETILLVEDETLVRDLAVRLLQRQGYRVQAFSNGAEALHSLHSAQEPIHLLITDIVMPGMNGLELARQAESSQPGLRILFTSGYSDGLLCPGELESKNTDFLAKPYTFPSLANKVRELLDRSITVESNQP